MLLLLFTSGCLEHDRSVHTILKGVSSRLAIQPVIGNTRFTYIVD